MPLGQTTLFFIGVYGHISIVGVPQIVTDSDTAQRFLATYKENVHAKRRFPLFRDDFLSVFWGTNPKTIELLLNRIDGRLRDERSMKNVPAAAVVTPNLDHLRMLFEVKDAELQETYTNALCKLLMDTLLS